MLSGSPILETLIMNTMHSTVESALAKRNNSEQRETGP